jgi:hypothetical protein
MKWSLMTWDKLWTGSNWLRIGPVVNSCKDADETEDPKEQ